MKVSVENWTAKTQIIKPVLLLIPCLHSTMTSVYTLPFLPSTLYLASHLLSTGTSVYTLPSLPSTSHHVSCVHSPCPLSALHHDLFASQYVPVYILPLRTLHHDFSLHTLYQVSYLRLTMLSVYSSRCPPLGSSMFLSTLCQVFHLHIPMSSVYTSPLFCFLSNMSAIFTLPYLLFAIH